MKALLMAALLLAGCTAAPDTAATKTLVESLIRGQVPAVMTSNDCTVSDHGGGQYLAACGPYSYVVNVPLSRVTPADATTQRMWDFTKH